MSFTGRLFRTAVYAGGAAAAVYFFDPEQGQARRAKAREQLEAKLRQAEGLTSSEPSTSAEPAAGDRVLDLATPDQPAPDKVETPQASQAATE